MTENEDTSNNLSNQHILDYLKVSRAKTIHDVLAFYEIIINPQPKESKVRNIILKIEVYVSGIFIQNTGSKSYELKKRICEDMIEMTLKTGMKKQN